MSEPRKALGRGLGALLPRGDSRTDRYSPPADVSEAAPEVKGEKEPALGSPRELPVDQIDPNPEQPRRHFDTSQLESLAASILRHGVLQPVVVRQAGDRFELIVGERRWRASRAAGLETIPAVVHELDPAARLEVAIVENVQREDLNPIELGHAYRTLSEGGASQEEIGRRVSKDRSSIANHIRLLDLPADIQEDVEEARITMGHAKALLQLSSSESQRQLRERIVKQSLSVRGAEGLARKWESVSPKKGAAVVAPGLDPNLQHTLESLQQRFQTRVRLTGRGQKGRLELDYFNPEDLERILTLLLRAH